MVLTPWRWPHAVRHTGGNNTGPGAFCFLRYHGVDKHCERCSRALLQQRRSSTATGVLPKKRQAVATDTATGSFALAIRMELQRRQRVPHAFEYRVEKYRETGIFARYLRPGSDTASGLLALIQYRRRQEQSERREWVLIQHHGRFEHGDGCERAYVRRATGKRRAVWCPFWQ